MKTSMLYLDIKARNIFSHYMKHANPYLIGPIGSDVLNVQMDNSPPSPRDSVWRMNENQSHNMELTMNEKYLQLLGLRGRLGGLRAQLLLQDQPNLQLQHEYDLQLAQYKTKLKEFLQWHNFYSTHGVHNEETAWLVEYTADQLNQIQPPDAPPGPGGAQNASACYTVYGL